MKRSATASALYLALASLAMDSRADAQAVASDDIRPRPGVSSPVSGGHLTPESTVGDLLAHPAFAGYGRLLLPWDGRDYNPSMPLENMGALMPYHSEVVPEVAVGALNRMIDDVNAGRQVFYDFAAGTVPTGETPVGNTGLFFLRGRPGAPFAVIVPGGGFAYVGSLHEGFPFAQEISRKGYNAFVLRYRAGQGGRAATEDLAAAVSWIFKHADALGVDTETYSLWGSSAGARMAAAVGSHGVASFGGDTLPKPSAVIMAYTGHADFSQDEPPTFVVVGEFDGIAPPAAMQQRVAALRRVGTEVEYREYEGLGHGFGLGTNTSAAGWIDAAVRFWERTRTGGGAATPTDGTAPN